jgi:hypothetical protein
MTKSANGTLYGRSGLEWGYDGQQFERDRRVTVYPYEMLGDGLYLSAEAKGILLTIFVRYWPHDAAPTTEHIRLEHRMTKLRFARLLEELTHAGVITIRGDTVAPAKSFGPDQNPASPRRDPREMPADWQDKREAVFARDGYACVYCGSGGIELHCDHVTPVVLGGGHEIGNLVTACSVCNLSKGSKTVAEWRPEIAERFR